MALLNSNNANIQAVITADDRASSVLKGFGDHVGKVGHNVALGLEAAAKGIAVATAAATAFGIASVKSFSEAEDGIAQTNAVLKSTGSVAGVTADQVTKLSNALQKTTRYSDEQVRSAENLLLTFTSIGKDIFPQATKTVLDMSTALGQDLKSSSIQLGKALQDPITGITALRRVGVNFSDAQQDLIKNLVETNRKAEAQRLILKELQTEFGGSAVAAGNTFAGALDRLKNALNDVQEQIGQLIVTRLGPMATAALQAVAAIDWNKVLDRSIASIKNFASEVHNLYKSISNYLTPGLETFWQIATQFAEFIYNMLEPSFAALWQTISTRLLPAIMALWQAIEPGFTKVLQGLGILVGVGLPAAMWLFINVLNIVISLIGGAIHVVSDLITWFGNLVGVVVNTVGSIITIVQNLIPAFKDVFGITVSIFKDLASLIAAPFKAAFNDVARAWNNTVGKLNFKAPSWVPGWGGRGWDVPDIPMLAEGGVVTKPTLAMIGEAGPEAVVPLNKAGAVSSIHITVQAGAFMGTDVEARKFAQIILGHLKDTAGSKNMSIQQMMGI